MTTSLEKAVPDNGSRLIKLLKFSSDLPIKLMTFHGLRLRPDGGVLFPGRSRTVLQEECIRTIRS